MGGNRSTRGFSLNVILTKAHVSVKGELGHEAGLASSKPRRKQAKARKKGA